MKLNRMTWVVGMVMVAGSSVAVAQDALLESGNPHNGLSSRAFRLNALTSNQDALAILATHALDDGLFSFREGYIAQQLRDPAAAAVMTELVACALDGSTTIQFSDPNSSVQHAWRGELGLCQRWHNGPPSRDCQEMVTACILARVNALDRSIPLSIRSEAAPVRSPRPEVHADTRFRDSRLGEDPSAGWPIDSFTVAPPPCGAGQDCDWESAYVGTCDPGDPTPIQLAIGNPSVCAAATLRVCGGIHGCDKMPHPAWPDGSPRPPAFPYSDHVIDQDGACRNHPLAFRCPAGGMTSGFYSVMVRSNGPHRGRKPSRVIQLGGAGSYPVAERKVFEFVEGAFYGNLFDPGMLRRTCQVTGDGATLDCTAGRRAGDKAALETCRVALPGDPTLPPDGNSTGGGGSGSGSGRWPKDALRKVGGADHSAAADRDVDNTCLQQDPAAPYANVYACYSYDNNRNASAAVAALNSRICDLPGGADCFPHPVQRCRFEPPASGPGVCDAMGTDGGYRRCAGTDGDGAVYRNVITTYLNGPCDLIGDPALCAQILAGRSTHPPGPWPWPPRPHGCAGCASGPGGGALGAASLAALVALIALRRRRRSAA